MMNLRENISRRPCRFRRSASRSFVRNVANLKLDMMVSRSGARMTETRSDVYGYNDRNELVSAGRTRLSRPHPSMNIPTTTSATVFLTSKRERGTGNGRYKLTRDCISTSRSIFSFHAIDAMNIKITTLGWAFSATFLASVVVAEAYCLLGVHFHLFGNMVEYQDALYTGILDVARAAMKAGSEEELVEMFSAENPRSLNKEDVYGLSFWGQEPYLVYYRDKSVPADWTFYEIDSILDYRGTLKIGTVDGKVQAVRLEYVFDEGN